MGRAVARLAGQADDLAVAGIWRRGDSLGTLLDDADVVVDFSLPEATESILQAVLQRRIPLVCGVSGLNAEQTALLQRAARDIPLVYDRNMSLGVAVLVRAVSGAAAALGPEFDVRIDETHHVHKKDAPSGTALMLGAAIAAALDAPDDAAIDYRSERRGDVPGEHEVTLASATETLQFRHSVTTRDVFANGALRAARWIRGQPAGQYAMQDVLFP